MCEAYREQLLDALEEEAIAQEQAILQKLSSKEKRKHLLKKVNVRIYIFYKFL